MLTRSCQDYNSAAIRLLSSKPTSPLKKVKRKVGYEDGAEEEADAATGSAQAQLKRLCLEERQKPDLDVPMASAT